jgi:hypothetical protein
MVRKFVFVPGAEPHVAPRGASRATGTSTSTISAHATATATTTKVMQWVLLGVALAISAVAFSAAKRTGDTGEPSPAAAHPASAGQ